MKVQTTRFGQIEVEDDRTIRFEKGVLGFPQDRDFVLLQTNEEGNFFWLQSVHRPELAFVVCDPLLFVTDYLVPLKEQEKAEIGLSDIKHVQMFIIVNKVGRELTGNLQGPLVINAMERRGMQMVLSEKKYSTRHPLINLDRVADQKRQAVSRTA